MKPNMRETADALRLVGRTLGVEKADYCFNGRFRFPLDAGWSLLLSPDDAGRFRLDACYRSTVRCSLWAQAEDGARLEALCLSAQHEAAALAA
jgi:hypothetical protein